MPERGARTATDDRPWYRESMGEHTAGPGARPTTSSEGMLASARALAPDGPAGIRTAGSKTGSER
ncbi:hypothetical protein [Thermomonospora umbrina]|uniref:Uncharacterized protein n=1 Tax=Thermomonospora umbrina TaxID=111806 RepID=A0A3D9SLI9_9ACTN|nr:hypothetical protein [Thermomonospora umbrina]REE96796.1 hypothetical protein DFJ69_2247 [Thermomonospora umbrina]